MGRIFLFTKTDTKPVPSLYQACVQGWWDEGVLRNFFAAFC